MPNRSPCLSPVPLPVMARGVTAGTFVSWVFFTFLQAGAEQQCMVTRSSRELGATGVWSRFISTKHHLRGRLHHCHLKELNMWVERVRPRSDILGPRANRPGEVSAAPQPAPLLQTCLATESGPAGSSGGLRRGGEGAAPSCVGDQRAPDPCQRPHGVGCAALHLPCVPVSSTHTLSPWGPDRGEMPGSGSPP